MKTTYASILPAVVAAALLGACVGTAGNDTARRPVTPPAAVTAGDSKTLADVPYGFQLVVQKGEEFYCKRELITGSRTNTRDVCLTLSQMEAQRNGTEDYLKRMRESPVDTQRDMRDGAGGRYNSVATQ